LDSYHISSAIDHYIASVDITTRWTINADDQKSIIVSGSAAGDPRNGPTCKSTPILSLPSLPSLSSFLVKSSDEFSSLGAFRGGGLHSSTL
jgi:hypothetical protein